MSIQSERQLQNTRRKLALLETRYAALERGGAENPRVRELTLHSLMGMINQFKEEIARYESRRAAAHFGEGAGQDA